VSLCQLCNDRFWDLAFEAEALNVNVIERHWVGFLGRVHNI
jgi:hypothetical protein